MNNLDHTSPTFSTLVLLTLIFITYPKTTTSIPVFYLASDPFDISSIHPNSLSTSDKTKEQILFDVDIPFLDSRHLILSTGKQTKKPNKSYHLFNPFDDGFKRLFHPTLSKKHHYQTAITLHKTFDYYTFCQIYKQAVNNLSRKFKTLFFHIPTIFRLSSSSPSSSISPSLFYIPLKSNHRLSASPLRFEQKNHLIETGYILSTRIEHQYIFISVQDPKFLLWDLNGNRNVLKPKLHVEKSGHSLWLFVNVENENGMLHSIRYKIWLKERDKIVGIDRVVKIRVVGKGNGKLAIEIIAILRAKRKAMNRLANRKQNILLKEYVNGRGRRSSSSRGKVGSTFGTERAYIKVSGEKSKDAYFQRTLFSSGSKSSHKITLFRQGALHAVHELFIVALFLTGLIWVTVIILAQVQTVARKVAWLVIHDVNFSSARGHREQ